jgi:hypothetical protein
MRVYLVYNEVKIKQLNVKLTLILLKPFLRTQKKPHHKWCGLTILV